MATTTAAAMCNMRSESSELCSVYSCVVRGWQFRFGVESGQRRRSGGRTDGQTDNGGGGGIKQMKFRKIIIIIVA